MKNSIILLILLFFSYVGTFIMRKIALKKSIIDIPNKRSSHTTPTPRGGGLSIAIVWYIFITVLYILGNLSLNLYLALFSSIVIAFVSFLDDLKNLSPSIRMLSQIVSTSLGLYWLGGLDILNLGFVTIYFPLWANIFVFIGIIWFINLFNFLDGIDGYLGSEGFFIFVSLFLLTGDFVTLSFAIIILGFLLWNWPKAKIFCGDVGSTLIGYTVIIFAIYFQNVQQLSFVIPFILTGLFWIDASITLFRRWLNKEKLSEAHKKHAYQRLAQAGLSHLHVVLIGLLINFFLFLFALIGYNFMKLLPIMFIAQIILVYIFIKLADNKKKFK